MNFSSMYHSLKNLFFLNVPLTLSLECKGYGIHTSFEGFASKKMFKSHSPQGESDRVRGI
jgi:hypothetical protein